MGKMEEERKAQKKYWEEHSKDLTVEAMMLDSRATDLDKEERPEVITHCHLLISVPVDLWQSSSIICRYAIIS
jgi:hypothetical protein